MKDIMADEELKQFHEGSSEADLEMLQEKRVCYFKYMLGGAKFYIGRDLKEVH